MYSRKVGDDVLSFGHQGGLYRKSFVMYDRQSESLWVHVSGQAIKGARKGQQLEFVPSEVLTWGDWVKRHPMTTALVGEKASGFMGTFTLDRRPQDFGLSVGQGRSVALLPYSMLRQVPVFHLHVDGQAIVATFDARAIRATAYSRLVDGQQLTFEAVIPPADDGSVTGKALARPALMRDSQSGSLWQRITGTCIAGKLKGKQLTPVAATPWLMDRWHGFFPKGKVYALPK